MNGIDEIHDILLYKLNCPNICKTGMEKSCKNKIKYFGIKYARNIMSLIIIYKILKTQTNLLLLF
jgi:hypothetical protein